MDIEDWIARAGPVGDGGLPRRRFSTVAAWGTGHIKLDEYLLYAPHHGSIRLEWDSGSSVIEPGRVMLIPPRCAFRARAGSPPPRLIRLRLKAPDGWGTEPVVFDMTSELRRVLDLLADRSDPGLPHAAAWSAAGGHLLAAALARAIAGKDSVSLVGRCATLVERDPTITPRQLARACGLTHDWFARSFRIAAGRSPRSWLVEQRVRFAAQALADGRDSAWAVAKRLGWRDPKLFGRQFRTVMGEPPGRWRRGSA
jgi:AraC-like DNA-binding protein